MCVILSNGYCVGRGVHNKTISSVCVCFKCLCLEMTLLSTDVQLRSDIFYSVMRWVEHSTAVQLQLMIHKDRFNASHRM